MAAPVGAGVEVDPPPLQLTMLDSIAIGSVRASVRMRNIRPERWSAEVLGRGFLVRDF